MSPRLKQQLRVFIRFHRVVGGYAFCMSAKRLGDVIKKVVDAAKNAEGGTNVVVARNIGGSGETHSVSARQRVVQRNGTTEIHEEREERRG